MGTFLDLIHSTSELLDNKLKNEIRLENTDIEYSNQAKKRRFEQDKITECEQQFCERRDIEPGQSRLELSEQRDLHDFQICKGSASSLLTILDSSLLNSWQSSTLKNIIGQYFATVSDNNLVVINAVLHSIWQQLHTGHWSQVPIELRIVFTWGSIILVGLLLKKLLADLEDEASMSSDRMKRRALRIVQACDRGLLMGQPISNNPLHSVASHLNTLVVKICDKANHTPHCAPTPTPPSDVIPEEAAPFDSVSSLETRNLPSLQEFLLNYKEGNRPLKITGITEAWPARGKWNFEYLSRIAGARTVPVEIGHRYTDEDWSQALMTMEQFLETLKSENEAKKDVKVRYLAQHQLLDQIPELLNDITVPDYCYTGDKEPIINAWVGPGGTVTPLHTDPYHNILVQVFGFKVILIFSEENSKFLYAYEDELLSNTSKLNLDEEVKKGDIFNRWPLLKNLYGHHLILGPGEALYLPPKWWHYVRSLTESISLSFWWS